MKNIALSLFALFIMNLASAQNYMFFPFDHDYGQVKEKLAQIDYINQLTPVNNSEIVAAYDNVDMVYNFSGSNLYNITMTKTYGHKKQAGVAMDGALDYFEKIDADVVNFKVTGNVKEYIAIQPGIVYQLSIITHSKRDIDIKLSSRYVRSTPRNDLDKYDILAMTPDNK